MWSASAVALLNTFFGEYQEERIIYPEIQPIHHDESELTLDQVSGIISGLKGRKAPGLDGSTGSMIIEFFRAAPEFDEVENGQSKYIAQKSR